MRPLHERFLVGITEERRRLTSRRSLVRRAAKLAGSGTLTVAVVGGTGFRRFTSAQEFAGDIDVLNYALTLEHLEATFYREGLEMFGADDFAGDVFDNLALIRDHEAAHVILLTDTVAQLGGAPVMELTYDFGYGDDPAAFLGVAQALENTGVQAYDGAAQFLTDPGLVTAAGGIVAVEARHASYLNDLNEDVPFPAAFEMPLPPDEVLDIATPFIVQ